VARMGEGRGAYRVLRGEALGKRPLRRPRCRWENNVKMYFQGFELMCLEWIVQAEERGSWRAVVNTVMNLRECMRCREFFDQLKKC